MKQKAAHIAPGTGIILLTLLIAATYSHATLPESWSPDRQFDLANPQAAPTPAPESVSTNRLPAIHIDSQYLKEKGRGNILQIARYRNDITLELPVFSKSHLFLAGNTWQENTFYDRKTHAAEGMTLAFNSSFSDNIRGEASWTMKRYEGNDFKDIDSGYCRLLFNIYDRASLTVGFERAEEIYNYFGMMQGVQSDNFWIFLSSDITDNLELNGLVKYISYTDDNEGFAARAAAGYAFTDHPRSLKLIVSAEYRDTKENYIAIYYDDFTFLANISHPYWCPWNYTAETVTLEWTHDLSGARTPAGMKHYYILAAAFTMDSENNPAGGLQGKWSRELGSHWSAGVTAMIYRSRKWDGEGAFAELNYRF